MNYPDDFFPTQEGFCHPAWDRINEAIQKLPEPARPEAWASAVEEWLNRLAAQLGPNYRIVATTHFWVLTDADDEVANEAGQAFERALKGIHQALAGVVSEDSSAPWVVLMISEIEPFYGYLDYFHPDGEHPMVSGVCLTSGGYLHLAFLTADYRSYLSVLVHELTHGCVAHLPLPLWVNEALAMRMEEVVCGGPPFRLDQETFDRHRDLWNPSTIQHFWSGGSWSIPGDFFELSYQMARILWHKIEADRSSSREALRSFVLNARAEDAGESACQEYLHRSLGDLVGDFLGEGQWAPAPATWPNASADGSS